METLAIVVILVLLAVMLATGGMVFLIRNLYAGARSRSLRRSPGESIRAELEEAQWDLVACLAAGMLVVPGALALYIAGGVAPALGLALAAQACVTWQAWRTIARLRALARAHQAEAAVGRELEALARGGYRVFHDFPVEARRFHIDHIVVGRNGVFAVETLHDAKPMAPAHADWLRAWLSSALGEPVWVQPLAVLPAGSAAGPVSGSGTALVAAGELQEYFAGLRRPAPLSDALIQRIVQRLAERGRDAAPRAGAQVRGHASDGRKAA